MVSHVCLSVCLLMQRLWPVLVAISRWFDSARQPHFDNNVLFRAYRHVFCFCV